MKHFLPLFVRVVSRNSCRYVSGSTLSQQRIFSCVTEQLLYGAATTESDRWILALRQKVLKCKKSTIYNIKKTEEAAYSSYDTND